MTTNTRARRGTRRVLALALASCVAALGLTSTSAHAAANVGQSLVGTFSITAGADAGPGVTGSYFRMIQPNNVFLPNSSSAATDKTYTYFTPGTDGGLKTGSFQPSVQPAFDGGGNALASRIVQPTGFFGVNFSLSTESPDLQTAATVAAPSIVASGGSLSGDLRAFGALWGGSTFNQGSPKPNGSYPGTTFEVTGTYNSTTNAYTLNWKSLIVGGPFNGFTGQWHFEGTFAGTKAPISQLRITTKTLPAATRAVPYSTEIKAITPASGIIVKFKKVGKLPKGLKLNPKTGVISGTPKLKKVSAGPVSFSIAATSKKSKALGIPKQVVTQAYTLNLL